MYYYNVVSSRDPTIVFLLVLLKKILTQYWKITRILELICQRVDYLFPFVIWFF